MVVEFGREVVEEVVEEVGRDVVEEVGREVVMVVTYAEELNGLGLHMYSPGCCCLQVFTFETTLIYIKATRQTLKKIKETKQER